MKGGAVTKRPPAIPQMRPWFGEEEKAAVCGYMDEDGYITEYERTARFEDEIAAYAGSKHCIVVNNGTVSLTLAAIAVGVGPGDEVIVPNYTMIATPNSVALLGATPRFVDVERSTLCMSLPALQDAISERTRAIMLVSPNGRTPESGFERYQEVADRFGVPIIEDAAQSLGARFPDGTHVGTKGVIGSFSFSAAKIISTGQGGALITDDDKLAHKLRRLKDFGRACGGTDIHDSIGFNFKFTELQAAVGLAQMRKLDWRVARKKEIFRRYAEGLSTVPEVEIFHHDLNRTPPWFIDSLVVDREKLIQFLRERQIGTRVMYPPINAQAAYCEPGSFPVSEEVGARGLWLPSASQLSDEDIDRVCDSIRTFYGHG